MTPPERGVDLTIDEVVLRGVPSEQAQEVLAHLETRLAELASEWTGDTASLRDRAESSRRLPAVDAPAGSASALGIAVAEAVWSEIDGGTRHWVR